MKAKAGDPGAILRIDPVRTPGLNRVIDAELAKNISLFIARAYPESSAKVATATDSDADVEMSSSSSSSRRMGMAC